MWPQGFIIFVLLTQNLGTILYLNKGSSIFSIRGMGQNSKITLTRQIHVHIISVSKIITLLLLYSYTFGGRKGVCKKSMFCMLLKMMKKWITPKHPGFQSLRVGTSSRVVARHFSKGDFAAEN